ncbi:hypothetical protein EVG20_g2187 [Dentipellis fragilis]|uniref:Uncharacterized protein n=1 Tax=Dentipellis fragilis TaxID=205917 RepID=A0A4Y9ZAI4_9AGAM|nr:hypothetical protein EVG20_g2187 [Dentipellis fragilis]
MGELTTTSALGRLSSPVASRQTGAGLISLSLLNSAGLGNAMMTFNDKIWIHVKAASFLISVDGDWNTIVGGIVKQGNLPRGQFVDYSGRNGNYGLRLCTGVPVVGRVDTCHPLYTSDLSDTTPSSRNFSSLDWMLPHGGDSQRLTIQGSLGEQGNPVIVSQSNNAGRLQFSIREEIALVVSQFWFFGLSLFAIIFESPPHLLALVIGRSLAAGWSTYALWRNGNFADRVQHLVGNSGTPCNLDIFPPYFQTRNAIADIVLHFVALAIFLPLSWRLLKLYDTLTFSRVGPPKKILTIYRYFLVVFVGLQLAVFFLVVAMSLWVDQLINGVIAAISSHTTIYQALFIFTTVTLLPWISLGWFSVRRERKYMMLAFISIGAIYVCAWSLMFYSQVYRFTWVDWPFFGCMTIISFIVVVISGAFGIVCRLQFGHGLLDYLQTEKSLARTDFEPDVFYHETEKEWTKADEENPDRITLPVLLSQTPGRV